MTDEVRKLVDGLEVLKLERLHPQTKEHQYANVVYKNDVIELIEKLTKWNKVEDCLPNVGSIVICRIKGRVSQLIYFGEDGFCYSDQELVTEWKPII